MDPMMGVICVDFEQARRGIIDSCSFVQMMYIAY